METQAYLVTRPPKTVPAQAIVNPRRGPLDSVPGLDIAKGSRLGDTMLSRFRLHEYVGCVSAEMDQRPIPHVFKTSETQLLTKLYVKWAPHIFSRIFAELSAPTQTFNKVSRLGYPYFTNPPNKQEILDGEFTRILSAGTSGWEASYVIVNVRLQAEPKSKEREFNFLGKDGTPFSKTVTSQDRTIEVKGMGKRVASRTRLIFNMPVPNLYKQCLDTAIHNVFLTYPAFHHDMFGKKILPVKGEHLCLDVKHFERFTADAVRHRGMAVIGGVYGAITKLFAEIPFLVPTADWQDFFFIRPNRKEGWSDQFASGDSAVAPVQKEIFTALYAEYFTQTRSLSTDAAITLVLNGGDESLTIRNYGDDNSLSGDPGELSDVFSFLKQYLHVEVEDPPKFLGFEWRGDDGWQLPPSSYLLKTYLNERRPFSNFRRYPWLGWVLKRETYELLGDPVIAENIYPTENKLLEANGIPWSDIAEYAERERRASLMTPGQLTPEWVLGKDYLMTAAQKLQTGQFIGFKPDRTAPIIKSLLSDEWRSKLTHI